MYKKEWKERKFRQQKNEMTFTKIKDQSRYTILVLINISKEEPYVAKNSFKYFIAYNDNDTISPLY